MTRRFDSQPVGGRTAATRAPATRPHLQVVEDDGWDEAVAGLGDTSQLPDDLNVRIYDRLPPMPQVILELNQALENGQTDARTISDLLAVEPSLVAQVLRIVNSAYYGLVRPIVRLKLAVAYLGFDQIRQIVMGAAVVERLAPREDAMLHRFWAHAYHTALAAKTLARTHERHLDPSELWPVALLHDVGVLVRLRLFPEHQVAIETYCEEHQVTEDEAELSLGLPTHMALGGLLADRWKLPPLVKDVCLHHHTLDAPLPPHPVNFQRAIRRMVYAADLLVERVAMPLQDDVRRRLETRAAEALGVGAAGLVASVAQVQDLRHDVDAFLQRL